MAFNTSEMTKYSNPSLNTISQLPENLGKISMNTIIERIENGWGECSTHQIVRTRLSLGRSTKSLVSKKIER